MKKDLNRRTFIGTVAAAGTTLMSRAAFPQGPQNIVQGQAPDGRVLKAGLVGCGGRGSGAAGNFLDAGPNLQITALADVFQDKVDAAREFLKKERGQDIPASRCFVG